ncbi:MAG: zinc ribbon domain-containing protein [Actinomycetota bacterium]
MSDDPLQLGLADLLDLQDVDLAIDRLLHQRQTLPELETYQRVAGRRDQLVNTHRVRGGELRKVELDLDKAEGELEILENKLKESETRLFAGGMSGRETEQKRLEVQALGGQREAMEARVFGIIELVDPLRDIVNGLEAEVAAANREVAGLEQAIAQAWKEIDAQIARREATKAGLAAPIPPQLMTLYEQLRRSKGGVAVGRLNGGICGGCHLTLSIPEQAEAAEWDPPRCIHCMRILVI